MRKEKLREEIYTILKTNGAENKLSWWNIASCIVDEWLPRQLKQNKGLSILSKRRQGSNL